jgi:hypothetical protein
MNRKDSRYLFRDLIPYLVQISGAFPDLFSVAVERRMTECSFFATAQGSWDGAIRHLARQACAIMSRTGAVGVERKLILSSDWRGGGKVGAEGGI